jgi:hypothetical protein
MEKAGTPSKMSGTAECLLRHGDKGKNENKKQFLR